MTERLLQFIWQFQYYDPKQLQTTEEEPLQIIYPGTYNTNQGPDFLNAKVNTGGATWAGSIELHTYASDWQKHNHDDDVNYANVILHVVWKDDLLAETLPFPTLELCNRVPGVLLKRYNDLMESQRFIPCEEHIAGIPSITILSWKECLLAERLQQRTKQVENYLAQNKWHWEETFWWMLARNFGVVVNSDAFEQVARSIPINLLAKNKNSIHKIEALLFGQAQLLDQTFEESYPALLRKEYLFFKQKYRLQKVHLPLHFMRMRPANFPTVRLAQLAVLITQSQHLFSKIKEAETLDEVAQLLSVTANDYWHYHYTFDEPAAFKKKTLGRQMLQNLLINTVVPVLFAYGHFNKDEPAKAKALLWMEQIDAEKNNITKGFEAFGIENKTAYDSQALIQLKNEYCNHRRCLHCAIGNKILKNR